MKMVNMFLIKKCKCYYWSSVLITNFKLVETNEIDTNVNNVSLVLKYFEEKLLICQ